MSTLAGNLGSVDDIRNTLALLHPENMLAVDWSIDYLQRSLEDEKQNRNRAGVINLLERKLKKIEKQKEGMGDE